MPDLLTIKTPHFVLSVWAKEVARSQALLAKTYDARGVPLSLTSMRFNPALEIEKIEAENDAAFLLVPDLILPEPLFFENKLYEFDFQFCDKQSVEPVIEHRLAAVVESFHYKNASLRGSINFGNDVGWFRLGVRYDAAGKEVLQYLSFEVSPTKMTMAEDLAVIHREVDKAYPLWRFSLAQKTDQELAKSRKPHERFPLLWLAHFGRLRTALEAGVRRICHTPHTRLLPYEYTVRAERLRGRLSPKLEECVTTRLQSGEFQHRYRITSQRLSVDTPENRFVKMVLVKSILEITRFKERVEREDKSPDQGRISTSFLDELNSWKKPLEQLLNRPFFAEVGAFEGLTAESLVLHQRAGYAAVYRIWQELKLYLDLFGRHAAISMKSVAELYEVWCLLEIRRMLSGDDGLGFTETSSIKAALNSRRLEKMFTEGEGAMFHFSRDDGIKIRLVHEPTFSKPNNPAFGRIYSWTIEQRPDIFLEATFVNGEKVQWIFDAKYRIDTDDNKADMPPNDAINQMHRYRDALIHWHKADDEQGEKTRPILGAFVLYPGCFDETKCSNPYAEAIEAVGIGSFPLLPGSNNVWLKDFLKLRFPRVDDADYVTPEPDHYLIEDSARIAPTGTYLERYEDLTLTAPLGPDRDEAYLNKFRDGTAGWYHIPLSTTNKVSVERNAMREVRYCAIAYGDAAKRSITHLYQVKSVKLMNRCELTLEQTGREDGEIHTKYWLFELGDAQPLQQALVFPVFPHFKFRLTNAACILETSDWETLPARYTSIK